MAEHGQNDKRLEDGVKVIRELGRDAALGKDSLPKLAFQITKMSADGVIDTEKKYSEALPDGGTRQYDDAEYLFTEYAKAEGKKAVHERTSGGLKVNISKLRQFVEFGALTTCDPQSVLERAANMRQTMAGNGEKVKPAYGAYVDIARAQKALDADMTDDQMAPVLRKPAKSDPDLRKVLEGVRKKLEAVMTGEGAPQDESELVETAYRAVEDRIKQIDAANNEAAVNTDEGVQAAAEIVQMLSADNRAKLLAALGYAQ